MNEKCTVSEGMAKRRSVCAYLGKAVQRDTVGALLTGAAQAFSNWNTQPWRVHVLTGDGKTQLTKAVFASAAEALVGNDPDVRTYRAGLANPWRQRRSDCDERMCESLKDYHPDRVFEEVHRY